MSVPPAGYVLCTTPRSGSTLLCTAMAATGRAGHSDSFYHRPEIMAEWARAWDLPSGADDRAYLTAAVAAGRGGTPVFGMRLQYHALASLLLTLGELFPDARSGGDRFADAFGPLRYIHLTRADRVAQAVSLVRARQTGLWHRDPDGRERERTGPVAEPAYDRAAIAAAVAELADAERGWEAWFVRERITPIELRYERLALSPRATVRELCAALDVPLPIDVPAVPGVRRLADDINRAWIARYRSEADPS